MLIAGRGSLGRAGHTIAVIDPSENRPIARVPRGVEFDVDDAVAAASDAYSRWRRVPASERAALLVAYADTIEANREDLIRLEAANVGKLLAEVDREITTSIVQVRGFARLMMEFWPDASNRHTRVDWQPLGVIGSLLPWNAPMSAVTRRIAITVATGNSTVIKPSTLGPLTPLRLAELAMTAGIPPGVINVVTGPGPTVGRYLAAHPGIAKVSFTGGAEAGDAIYRSSARIRRPVAVELGGKSAQVVFEDAPWDLAQSGVIRGFTRNAGQICTSGTRLLVARSIADRFIAELVERVAKMRVGRSDDPLSDMGPQITLSHRASIHEFVERARSTGRTVATGGTFEHGSGFFYRPTIVVDVDPDDEIFQSEVFGPVLSVTRFDSDQDAIALANATEFGMACGIWTLDVDRASTTTNDIEAGTCWVNSYWSSPVDLSRSAWKASGFGAMDFGVEGLREYMRFKQIVQM